jgi:lysophospholipase L1-like esterase
MFRRAHARRAARPHRHAQAWACLTAGLVLSALLVSAEPLTDAGFATAGRGDALRHQAVGVERLRLAAVSASAPTPWRVVSLGDSVVSGGPCDCWTFPGRYARLVTSRTGHSAVARNLGVGGSTSADLLRSLRAGSPVLGVLHGAKIVTITIGANDLVPSRVSWNEGTCEGCFYATADTVEANLTRIVRQVRAAVGTSPVELLVTTYWNVFKEPETAAQAAGNSTRYDVMARRATLILNAAICRAAARTGAVCAGLFAPFKGDGTRDALGLLEPDRDHPNAAGHQVIAEALAAHGWRWLSA